MENSFSRLILKPSCQEVGVRQQHVDNVRGCWPKRAALRLERGLTPSLSQGPPPLTCNITLGKTRRQVAHTTTFSLANLVNGHDSIVEPFLQPVRKVLRSVWDRKCVLVWHSGNQMWGMVTTVNYNPYSLNSCILAAHVVLVSYSHKCVSGVLVGFQCSKKQKGFFWFEPQHATSATNHKYFGDIKNTETGLNRQASPTEKK